MSTSVEPCEFPGNPDIYGIGVRIGLYSQWVATLLVTLFSPKEEETFRIINITIQSSIFLGIAVQSATETNPVEPIIVIFLMCGALSSLTGDGIRNFTHVSGVVRSLFYTALSAYGVWYWFGGLDQMMKGMMEGCDAIAFFGRTRVEGWFRRLGQAVSVLGLMVSICFVGVCAGALRRRFLIRNRFAESMARPRRQRSQVEIAFLILSGGLISFSVIIVEYLIRVNGVSGLSQIDAVGQLIPFLIGILELTSITWKILIKGLFFGKRCWFFFGKHL